MGEKRLADTKIYVSVHFTIFFWLKQFVVAFSPGGLTTVCGCKKYASMKHVYGLVLALGTVVFAGCGAGSVEKQNEEGVVP